MELSFTLYQRIIDFLKSIPNIQDADIQKKLIAEAGLYITLKDNVTFGTPPMQFVPSLLSTYINYIEKNQHQYKRLKDIPSAVEAILTATKNYVGVDGQNRINQLIQELHGEIVEIKYNTQSPITLNEKIIGFLNSLPGIEEQSHRKALIAQAGLDRELQNQITFDDPLAQFFPQLLDTLRSYEKLEDGRDALEAVLEAAMTRVGEKTQRKFEDLIQELHNEHIQGKENIENKDIERTSDIYEKSGIEQGNSIELPSELHEKVVAFLASLPNMQDKNIQQALFYSAGLFDPQLIDQLPFGTPPVSFFRLSVATLIAYGKLNDGRNAIEAILEAAKQFIGNDRKTYCDTLIHALQNKNDDIEEEPDIGLPSTLRNRIVQMLISLPNVHDNQSQRALIIQAGLDKLNNQILFSGPPMQFFQTLISTLSCYGTLADGRDPVEAILYATKNYVGPDRKKEINLLIKELRNHRISTNTFITSDLELLQQIENEMGKKLSLYEGDDNKIESTQNTYALDESKNVIGLNIYSHFFTDLAVRIARLGHLKKIILKNNRLWEFPRELLELKNLTTLDLEDNQLSTLPEAILNLQHLKYLSLQKNRFTTLPFSIVRLNNFQVLDLRHNQITALPEDIVNVDVSIKCEMDTEQAGIYLEGNKFKNLPIEILKQGKEAIRSYFNSLKAEQRTLQEVKVLLVGDGGAGKTSLVKQIRKQKFDKNEPQTHGININSWYTPHTYIKVNFWDFGGQDIMHATHQFFLSKRSLYVLVLDGRKEEDPEYWLENIKSFGGDSPILVVINKIDENPGFDENRKFLRQKYSNIKAFYRISCNTNEGIDFFTNDLSSHLLQIDHLQTIWPRNWFAIKTELERMSENFITYERYIQICEHAGITADEDQTTLMKFLHDLGIVLHFDDPALKETNVINPHWTTEAVYAIINAPQLAINKGVLTYEILSQVLSDQKRYPKRKHDYIIELMKKFELCYSLSDNTFLIPDLLGKDEPEFDFDDTNALQFRFEYEFLPRSIMPRFIVRMHHDIKDNLRWRTGVVLENQKSKAIAVIKADKREKKIFVAVQGAEKRDYFAVIRRTLQDIKESFEKLECTELVPLPDYPHVTVEYDELIGHERMGEKYITIGKVGKKYLVAQLLDGIENKEERVKHTSTGEGSAVYYYNIQEVKNMSNIDVKVRDVNMGKGDFVVAETIQNSFNKVEASNAPNDLKELLKALATDIGQMMKQLPKEQAEEVADDLDKLTTEAIKDKPKRKWWEVSAKGLKEAAATVGEIGVSVITNLDKIIPILEKMS